jgi:tetratricopeptide (TPR) repeat protein
MNHRTFCRFTAIALIAVASILTVNLGCGPLRPVGKFYDNFTAHYNTYYNVKKKFAAAEKVTRQNLLLQTGTATAPAVPTALYQAVIESGASLLEYYPNCRWIDDTLILMGIAYYRLSELGRAERKFSELITIFPTSEHAASAIVWRARTIAQQGRLDEAETGLSEALPDLKGKEEIAEAHRVLATIFTQKKQWKSASEHYELAAADIGNRNVRCDVWFALGEALIAQADYTRAREVFAQVIDRSRIENQIYEASILWSRCAMELGDYAGAEKTLKQIQSDPDFVEKKSSIDVEIAAIAVANGDVDRGIGIYQGFIDSSPNSEKKGQAYYRLGEIYREMRIDLAMARAKFDSVASSGAARSLIDSAKIASDGLSKGLGAFTRLATLKDSLTAVEAAIDSIQGIDWSIFQSDSTPVDSMLLVNDSLLNKASLQVDTVTQAPAESSVPVKDSLLNVSDSLSNEVSAAKDSIVQRPVTPATLLADSILKALQGSNTAKKDIDSILTDSTFTIPTPSETDTNSTEEKQALQKEAKLDSTRMALKQAIMSTYLRIAEFFEENLQESDSSMKYLELATEETVQNDDFWKACLQLADRLERKESPDQNRIRSLYEKALEVETMPIAVRNSIRGKLGYETQSESVPLQEASLLDAEAAFLADSVSTDSIVAMYGNVVNMDSTSSSALKALFALEYIYEYRLADFESAKHITQAIINLFPDSSFVTALQLKLTEREGSSIFDLTDEQIAEARAKSHVSLSAAPDSTGWPPPEETLKGRRYR